MTSQLLLEATQVLLESTSRATGEEFFRGLARGLARALGVKAAFVGELGPDERSVKTHAVWWDDHFAPPIDYPLGGTPCEQVHDVGMCFHPAGVQQMFPSDELLREMGVESYLGIPVCGGAGEPLGILVALHDKPTDGLEVRELDTVFHLFAARAGAELERLRADEKLRASEARYRQIVTSCHEGVWTIDAVGNTTFVNEQMAAMLGYAPDEMLGRPLHEFMDEEARRTSDANIEKRQQGISERHSFRFKSKDGRDVWTVLSASPLLDADGAYQGALAMATDETELKTLERKIQQAQKLESLGVLAGTVAHDFNNLLVAILGNAALVRGALPPGSRALAPLLDLETAATRAADLTRQLLAYSGRGRFVVSRVGLNALIEELVRLLSTVVSARAHLRLSLAADLPDVDGDATQLRQVVMNLVTNASDSLGQGDGVVTISTGVQKISGSDLDSSYLMPIPDGTYVYIEVKDTGAGMDQAAIARIFEPFFTTKGTGRGLGLAAVLGILKGHHGSVRVESAPGKGSCFRVLLPPTRGAHQADKAQPRPEGTPAQGVVLFADDDPHVRKLGSNVLRDAGFTVLSAADGKQAVELFELHEGEILAAVFDVKMPGLDGPAALEKIRTRCPSLPAVLSSGYTDRELPDSDRVEFLPKPWKPADLLEAIQRAIARQAR